MAVNEEQRGLFFSTQSGMSPTPQTSPRLHENSWLLAGHSLAFFSAPEASSFADVKASAPAARHQSPGFGVATVSGASACPGNTPTRKQVRDLECACALLASPEAGCPGLDPRDPAAPWPPLPAGRRPGQLPGSCLSFGGICGICLLPRGLSLPALQSSCLFWEPGGVRASHSSYLSD